MSTTHAAAPSVSPQRSINYVGAIYGTVVATSTAAAISNGDQGPWQEVIILVSTGLIFWIAHVHAALIARWLQEGRTPTRREVRAEMTREWPLAQASFPLAVPLVLAGVGILDTDVAGVIALLVGVAGLTGWGLAVARAGRLRWPAALFVIGLNILLGLAVVILKLLVH